MKNTTSDLMPLDLLREDIQLLISIIVITELKLILISTSDFYLRGVDNNFMVDNCIKFLILTSKQKILIRLSVNIATTLDISNQWTIKKIQIEEYPSIITLLKSLSSWEALENSSTTLITSLIENLVIKLSNSIVYELFSSGKLSRLNVLKWYTIDYLLFSYNLFNLKTYSYWKYYIEAMYSNIKRFSTDTYPLFICTRNGVELKRLYSLDLCYNSRASRLQIFVSKFLNFIEYMIYSKRK
jgi:hypothetical protein